jgi:hypothetical protein
MSPQYAIKWWRERRLTPPKIAPVDFFAKKLRWRYAKGIPEVSKSVVLFGDSALLMADLKHKSSRGDVPQPSLMLTSPPYFGITNYHYDQWIRLWLLGGPATDRRAGTQFQGIHQGKFSNVGAYRDLLSSVFENSAKMLRNDAVVYVRSDRREPTLSIMKSVLKAAFPSHNLRRTNRPVTDQTQTRLFGHHAPRLGEVDFLLTPQHSE